MAVYFEDLFKYNDLAEFIASGKWETVGLTNYFPADWGQDHECDTIRGAKSGNVGSTTNPQWGGIRSVTFNTDSTKDIVIKLSSTIDTPGTNVGTEFNYMYFYNSTDTIATSGYLNLIPTYTGYTKLTLELVNGETVIKLFPDGGNYLFTVDLVFLASSNFQTVEIWLDGIWHSNISINPSHTDFDKMYVQPAFGRSGFEYNTSSIMSWIQRGIIVSDEIVCLGDPCLCSGPIIIKNNLIDHLDTHNGTYDGREYWKKSPLICGGE